MSEFIEVPAVEGADCGEAEGVPLIVADVAPTFTCASHQNSLSVVRSIRVENSTDESLDDLRLELTASPPFLRSKTWIIDDSVAQRVPFLRPAGRHHRRSLGEISIAELAAFTATHPDAFGEDSPLVYARLLQVERLAGRSRERLQKAIQRSRA
jgi:hypothetical protein